MNCYQTLIEKANIKNGYIIYNKTKISLTTFVKKIDIFAYKLVNELGFKKGDVLSIYLPTCVQSLVAFYGCSKVGVIANLIHPLMPIESVKELIIKNKSKGLMYFDILIKNDNIFKDLNQILIKCCLSEFSGFYSGIYKMFVLSKGHKHKNSISFFRLSNTRNPKKIKSFKNNTEIKGFDVVCRMHSGGTTGSPKVIELSHDALNNLSDNLNIMYDKEIIPNKNSLVLLPIFHAYGLGVSIHTCLLNKYNLILVPRFNSKQVAKMFKKYKINFVAGIPIMFKKIIEYKSFIGDHLKYLEDVFCGGDILSENDVEHFNTIMDKNKSSARIMRGYGLTEACGVVCTNTRNNYKKFSCGKPIPNTIIEIWDENQKKLEPNHIGDIAICNNSIMNNYLNDKGYIIKNNKKWIKTGDVGYLDEDGFLFLTGRSKRSFKINAFNIYPEEIEKLVSTIDNINEVCAVSYFHQNKTLIKLYISLKDKNANIKLLKEQIKKLCKNNLIKYAVPHYIEVLDSLPRTNIGKIDFNALANR